MRSRSTTTRRLAAPVTALAALMSLLAASPASAATTRLGGVDMQRACNQQYPGRGTQAVVTDGGSAYSWQCRSASFAGGIDVNAACANQYGWGAYAGLGNRANPYTWFCQGWTVTARMQGAVNWAYAELRSPDPAWSDHLRRPWAGWCEVFVEQANGFRFRFGSAVEHFNRQNAEGRIHRDANPPAGAVVFYGGGGGYGHVGVAVGNGQVISTQGVAGQRLPVRLHGVTAMSNPYYGWAYPYGA
jgi:hypothetical protein